MRYLKGLKWDYLYFDQFKFWEMGKIDCLQDCVTSSFDSTFNNFNRNSIKIQIQGCLQWKLIKKKHQNALIKFINFNFIDFDLLIASATQHNRHTHPLHLCLSLITIRCESVAEWNPFLIYNEEKIYIKIN